MNVMCSSSSSVLAQLQLSVVAALSIVSLGSISDGANQTYSGTLTASERSQSQGAAASAAAAVVFGAPSDGIVAHGTSPGVRSTALSE